MWSFLSANLLKFYQNLEGLDNSVHSSEYLKRILSIFSINFFLLTVVSWLFCIFTRVAVFKRSFPRKMKGCCWKQPSSRERQDRVVSSQMYKSSHWCALTAKLDWMDRQRHNSTLRTLVTRILAKWQRSLLISLAHIIKFFGDYPWP